VLKGTVFARHSTTVIGLKQINAKNRALTANDNFAFANDNNEISAEVARAA
jgi:hypothetical protein